MPYLNPSNEIARQAALDALQILDTPAEERFDRFTRLATLTFRVPAALVSLVDADRQWFKSCFGLDAQETPRSIAFCSHAIEQEETFVIEDAQLDPRFADNPFVTGAPFVRFYAGQPVFSEGYAVGTLCIIDYVPRTFDDQQRQVLRDLANLVEAELNHAKAQTARLLAEQAIKALNVDLERRIALRTEELQVKVAELSHEIARRNAAEGSLRQSEAWNRTIVTSSYSGFVGADEDGTIVEWNPSAERIFGWTRAQAVGRNLLELIIPVHMREGHKEGMQRFRETGMGTVIDRKLEMPALTANGREITVEMTISAYEWYGKRYFGAFMNDISERIRTQQQLEEKQELLDAVLESIDVSVVACDAIGNLTLFNRTARTLHGTDLKAIAPSEWSRYYSLYHGDGRTPLAMDEIPLVRALKGFTVRDQAMVVAPQDQAPRALLASGRLLRGASGRSLGAVVVMKDITELNASREKLAANERRLRTITDNVPVLIAQLDNKRRYSFANAVHASWLGESGEKILGKTMEEAFGPEYHGQQAAALEQAWRGQVAQCEHEIVRKNHTRIVHSMFLPQLRDGVVSDVFVLTTDATASRQHERSLHALAHTDALTSLPNRRHFEAAMEGLATKAPQPGRHVALLYLDIDHFKQINDLHGHAVGDAVLVEFARRLRSAVRSSDIVARLAGDEFTVLLQDIRNEEDTEFVMRKILESMWKPFILPNCTLDVGTTIGAAMAAGPILTPQLLMESADSALYKAKNAGRNTYAIQNLCHAIPAPVRLAQV